MGDKDLEIFWRFAGGLWTQCEKNLQKFAFTNGRAVLVNRGDWRVPARCGFDADREAWLRKPLGAVEGPRSEWRRFPF